MLTTGGKQETKSVEPSIKPNLVLVRAVRERLLSRSQQQLEGSVPAAAAFVKVSPTLFLILCSNTFLYVTKCTKIKSREPCSPDPLREQDLLKVRAPATPELFFPRVCLPTIKMRRCSTLQNQLSIVWYVLFPCAAALHCSRTLNNKVALVSRVTMNTHRLIFTHSLKHESQNNPEYK